MKKGIIVLILTTLTYSVFAQMSVSYGDYLDCTDANKSKIWARVSGGTPPYEYSWNNGPYTSNDTLYTPVRASQKVVVRDAVGTTATRTRTIGGIDAKGSFSVTTENPDLTICPNPQVEATIGYYPLGSSINSFNWSDGSQDLAGNTFVKMVTAPIDYMVTITTSSGCLQYDTLRIVPDSTFYSSIDIYRPDIGCAYQRCIYATPSDSFLDPYVIQPTGPYSYEWSTSNAIIPTYDTTSINCDIMSYASYSVTVTTASGCTSTATMANIGNIEPIIIRDVVIDTPSCTNDGSVTLDILGGVAPVSVVWIEDDFNQNVVDSGFTIDNLTYVGGDYIVYVQDF